MSAEQISQTQNSLLGWGPGKVARVGSNLLTLFNSNPETMVAVKESVEASVDTNVLKTTTTPQNLKTHARDRILILKIIGTPFYMTYQFISKASGKASAFVYFSLIFGTFMSMLMAVVFYIYGKQDHKILPGNNIIKGLYYMSQVEDDSFSSAAKKVFLQKGKNLLGNVQFQGYSLGDFVTSMNTVLENMGITIQENNIVPLNNTITAQDAILNSFELFKMISVNITIIGLDIFFSLISYPVDILGMLLNLQNRKWRDNVRKKFKNTKLKFKLFRSLLQLKNLPKEKTL